MKSATAEIFSDSTRKAARKAANRAMKEGRSYLGAKSRIAYQLGKRMRKTYPVLAHDARDAASAGARDLRKAAAARAHDLKEALRIASHDAYDVSSRFYHRGVRSMEFRVLKVAAIYVAVKWFARNPRVAEVSENVKAHVKAQPVESAVIALGIGFIIGRILG